MLINLDDSPKHICFVITNLQKDFRVSWTFFVLWTEGQTDSWHYSVWLCIVHC